MFRRKTMPSHLVRRWEAFQAQASRVEAARRALLGCLPVGRVDPAPVPVGLDLLSDELAAVRAEMDVWKTAEVAQAWEACRDAIDEALGAIPHAHEVAKASGELEELLGAVSDVVEPLEAWAAAEQRWRALRTRNSPGDPLAPGAVS
jgi:hypothetical protein